MFASQSLSECAEVLRQRAVGRPLRAVASELGYRPYKAAFLSHVLGKRAKHVSEQALDDLRERLGLLPVFPVAVSRCPVCHGVHTRTCARARRALRKSVHLSPDAFDRLNAARQARGETETWERFLLMLIDF